MVSGLSLVEVLKDVAQAGLARKEHSLRKFSEFLENSRTFANVREQSMEALGE
jgi:hypothetical protein